MELNVERLKALTSRTRLDVLRQIHRQKQATVTSTSQELDLSKSTVSEHLEILRQSGLIEKQTEEGRKRVEYSTTEIGEKLAEGRKVPVRLAGLGLISLGSSTVLKLLPDPSAGSQDAAAESLTAESSPAATETPALAANLATLELVLAAGGLICLIAATALYLRPVLKK